MQTIVETDLVIVGGGPAGAAAAIAARSYGLRVIVVERDATARIRPGEAAHPGIEPLLIRLGVTDAVQAAGFLRYEGHWIAWGGKPLRFEPCGSDERGPWKGYQLWRPDFDATLLNAADRAGARIIRPCGEAHPIVDDGRIAGVRTSAGIWRSAFVIDATGRQRWLARALRLPVEHHGPPRVAWFGYAEGHCPVVDRNPMIASDARGWTWTARVRPNLYQWVRMPLQGPRPPNDWCPIEFAGLQPMRQRRGIDVSCTIANPTAGPGYFLTGDAASIVDPLSSHGILKAVMSGMKAAHHSAAVLRGGVSPDAAASTYHDWFAQWFHQDCSGLDDLYRAIAGNPRREQPHPEDRRQRVKEQGMKIVRKAILIAGALVFTSAPLMPAKGQIGGGCAYESYTGTCTITAVSKTKASASQKTIAGGPGYAGFDVKFKYVGEAPNDNVLVRQALGRQHDLRLANSWYPGPRFLAKYAIAPGKAFGCALKVIRTGSCTPTVFQFSAIDQTDYFEH